MKNIILFVVIVTVAVYIFLVIKKNREASAPQYVEQAVTLSPKQAEPQPQPPPINYPVAPVEPEPEQIPPPAPEPLPALDESDDTLFAGLTALAVDIHWQELFLPTALVRRFVVTVDNMTADKLPQKYRFTRSPPGSFRIQKAGDDHLSIAVDNYGRYASYVRLVETIDLKRLTALYRRYYPLFQQAYEELGYPGRYFNDRLIEVIDHLLAVPEVKGPIELKQPKVYYVFADPELEAMSAGRKMLVRIGPNNAAMVKTRLRELRSLLAGLSSMNTQ